MSFLDAIVKNTRVRVAERRAKEPISELRARLSDLPAPRSLEAALSRGFSVIAEHKRRAPSSGPMEPKNVESCLGVYAKEPWVSAVSVLTDTDFFDGKREDLFPAREATGKPILRKDFIIDEYQVVEARAFGADAILLMASVLASDPGVMRGLHDLARSIGLEVLVEIGMTERRMEDLVTVVPEDARIWGINARAFAKADKDAPVDPHAKHALSTDVSRHVQYRKLVPVGKLAVAESGIHTADELRAARDAGYDAALIGTAFLVGPKPISAVTKELARAFSQ